MFDLENMNKEEREGMHSFIDSLIGMMAENGSPKFKGLKYRNDLMDKTGKLLGTKEFIKDDDITEKTVSLLEQFNKLIDDFIEENNINIEEVEGI